MVYFWALITISRKVRWSEQVKVGMWGPRRFFFFLFSVNVELKPSFVNKDIAFSCASWEWGILDYHHPKCMQCIIETHFIWYHPITYFIKQQSRNVKVQDENNNLSDHFLSFIIYYRLERKKGFAFFMLVTCTLIICNLRS